MSFTIWNSSKDKHLIPVGAIYIGRPGPFGNPFFIGKNGTREEVIKQHMEWAREQLKRNPGWLNPLINATDIICWCSPEPCHGENYQILVEEIKNQVL